MGKGWSSTKVTDEEWEAYKLHLLTLNPICRKCGGANWYYPPNVRMRMCRDCHCRSVSRRHRRSPEKRYPIQRRANLKAHHGVTPEWFEEKMREQGGVCAACGNPEYRMSGGRGTPRLKRLA